MRRMLSCVLESFARSAALTWKGPDAIIRIPRSQGIARIQLLLGKCRPSSVEALGPKSEFKHSGEILICNIYYIKLMFKSECVLIMHIHLLDVVFDCARKGWNRKVWAHAKKYQVSVHNFVLCISSDAHLTAASFFEPSSRDTLNSTSSPTTKSLEEQPSKLSKWKKMSIARSQRAMVPKLFFKRATCNHLRHNGSSYYS